MADGALLDPRLLDLALALIALEGLALWGWRLWSGQGPAPLALLPNLLSGAFLILVARALLSGAGPLWAGAALTGALIAHLADLAARWRRAPRTGRDNIARAELTL
jgi:hypothetical protein